MQRGVTVVEISMFVVVLAIIAVVAIPQFSLNQSDQHFQRNVQQKNDSNDRVKSAFALAIAKKGDFPTLTELVEFIDADFASETNDLSGVTFRDQRQQLTVNTYVDSQCLTLTTAAQSGVSDIVRCVQGLN